MTQGFEAQAAIKRDDRAATFQRVPRCLPSNRGNKPYVPCKFRGGVVHTICTGGGVNGCAGSPVTAAQRIPPHMDRTAAGPVQRLLGGRLRGAFTRWGLAPEGTYPCKHVVKYPERKRERFLTDAEFERLGRILDEAANKGGASAPAVAAFRMLMLTGCRKGEILTPALGGCGA